MDEKMLAAWERWMKSDGLTFAPEVTEQMEVRVLMRLAFEAGYKLAQAEGLGG